MNAPLDPQRRKQLDENLRKMSESGASPEDITKYATDFKAKFEQPPSEDFFKYTRLIRAIRAFFFVRWDAARKEWNK